MEIKKFVIKKGTNYEDRTDCWFRTGNVWHQTVPSNCLLLTLDPKVESIFNENLFVILDSEEHGNTYGKTAHILEDHNIILSSDYAPISYHHTTPGGAKGYFHTNSEGHKHDNITLRSGSYSEENFYSLFDRYAVGAYTKDYILANSLLLSTKDISNGNIQKILEDLNYFLFIDATRRGKLNRVSTHHNHGGTGSINVPPVDLSDYTHQGFQNGSTTGITSYIDHTHTVNYTISDCDGVSAHKYPKNFLLMYYNKTINDLYFDELPIGTIMLFIDKYNDYMYNWIPLECSKCYCSCGLNYDQNIDSFYNNYHYHKVEFNGQSLKNYGSYKGGTTTPNEHGFSITDHSHTFTFGNCSKVYLEPYGLMLKPYIKISNNKPNF